MGLVKLLPSFGFLLKPNSGFAGRAEFGLWRARKPLFAATLANIFNKLHVSDNRYYPRIVKGKFELF